MGHLPDDPFHWIRAIPEYGSHLPSPHTVDDLNRVEEILKTRLPKGYRDFAQRFGIGGRFHGLPELLPLAAPKRTPSGQWWASIVKATRHFRETDDEDEQIAPKDFLSHALVFGDGAGEFVYLFHTDEITDSGGPEYRVYQIPRHEEPEVIGDSFDSWLKHIHEHYCLSYKELLEFGEEADEELLNFYRVNGPSATPPLIYRRTV